jgi:hypothetical protein
VTTAGAVRRAAAIVACAAATVAACGDVADRSRPNPRAIFDATRGADSARFVLQVAVTGFEDAPDDIFEFSGVADFARRRGVATGRIRPRSETATTATAERDVPPADEASPVEIRWIGPDFYQYAHDEELFGATGARPWIRVDGDRLLDAAPCAREQIEDPFARQASFALVPDPVGTLDALPSLDRPLERVGADTVRGVPTVHWRVADVALPTPCAPGPDDRPAFVSTIEVWIDGDQRARRIRTRTEAAGDDARPDRPTGPWDSSVEFFDFGVAVEVEAPPADQVHDLTEFMISGFQGVGQVDPGDWRVGARGSFSGRAWTVWHARTSTGYDCYDVVGLATAGGGGFESSGPGTAAPPTHEGREATCWPRALPRAVPFVALAGERAGDESVMVGIVDVAAGSARFEFADGTSVPADTDPDTRLAQWSGPTASRPVRVTSEGGSCALEFALSVLGEDHTVLASPPSREEIERMLEELQRSPPSGLELTGSFCDGVVSLAEVREALR